MKTIEQFKKDLIIELACDDDTLIRCAVNETIKFAQRWISVDDELPESDSQVLVKWNNNRCVVNSYDAIDKKWQYEFDSVTITHWRPIELE